MAVPTPPKLTAKQGSEFFGLASSLLMSPGSSDGAIATKQKLEILMRFLLGKTPEDTELKELAKEVDSNGSIDLSMLHDLKAQEIPSENPYISVVKKITAAFQEKDKRGLAIVVANQQVPWKDYGNLGNGLTKVAKEMCETFEYLKFSVVYLEGEGSEVVKACIDVAAQSQHPNTFNRFVFYFAGHGKKDDSEYIIGTDQKGVKINEEILLKFQPMNAQQIASMPKLFFFDCCRGIFKDKGVMQGKSRVATDADDIQESMEEFVRITIRPSLGNSLLACAVMSNFQALTDKDEGPIWGQVLQKHLRKNQSIYDVLQGVNEAVMSVYDEWWSDPEKRKNAFGEADGGFAEYRFYAQPAFTSTLHGPIINLCQEAYGDVEPLTGN